MTTDSLDHCFRLHSTAEGWDLEISRTTWASPDEPIHCWKRFRHWRHHPTDESLRRALKTALRRFFQGKDDMGKGGKRGSRSRSQDSSHFGINALKNSTFATCFD